MQPLRCKMKEASKTPSYEYLVTETQPIPTPPDTKPCTHLPSVHQMVTHVQLNITLCL